MDKRDLEELNRIRASTRESLGIWKGSSSPLGNNCYVIRPDDRNRIYHQQRSGLYELTVIYDGGPRDAFNAAFIPADKPGKPEKVRLADVGKKTGVYIIFDRDDIHLIDTASDRKSLLKNR